MAVTTLRRVADPHRLAAALAHAGQHPRVLRLRAACHPLPQLFESGAANGAITAYGWRGFALVPIVVAVSLVLTRLQGLRIRGLA